MSGRRRVGKKVWGIKMEEGEGGMEREEDEIKGSAVAVATK